jgi:L-alanine-DL-glutamate epimerase-like enolase superfamily enzyme
VRITDIKVQRFKTILDSWDRDHGVSLPKSERIQTIVTIETDAGISGHYIGGGFGGDSYPLSLADIEMIHGRVRKLLVGQDPLDRELIWKWFWVAANMPEIIGSVVDNALWDLAGRALNLPVHKLMGGAGRRVKAYASSHKNMGRPRDYADHAMACKRQGYLAYKIHPHYFWNPETRQPTPGRPSNIKVDIETARMVREAVGPDYVLMYDPWGTYMTMEEALEVGRELERLNFYWFEHPMPETRVEMYVKLCRDLTIPVLSPEIAAGGVFTRADWILRGASDMSRIDCHRGGITGARKTAIICEAYGLRCELHMSGWANLQVIGATHEDTAEYYERGLLAPGVDYDAVPPHLRANCDPLDPDGYITLPTRPGLGYDIVWDYINDNLVK